MQNLTYQDLLDAFAKIPSHEIDAYPAERCSDGKQSDGSTWFRQNEVTKLGVLKRGWNYRGDQAVIDDGKSAFHLENFADDSQLMKFLAAAKAGHIVPGKTVLVFAALNRYTRAPLSKGLDMLRRITEAGIAVYFCDLDLLIVHGFMDDAMITNRLTWAMDIARKEIQNRQLHSFYSHKKKQKDIENGIVVNTGIYPPWIQFHGDSKKPGAYMESKKLVFPDTENLMTRWDVVTTMRDLLLADHSPREVCKFANNHQPPIPPFRGGKFWRPGDILRMFRSDLMLGIATLGGTLTPDRKKKVRGTLKKAIYPAVCTQEQFDQIQHNLDKLARDFGPSDRPDRVNNLLPRLVKCSVCGSGVQVDSHTIKNTLYRSYRCSSHCTGGKCTVSSTIPVEILERDLFLHVFQQDCRLFLNNQDVELRQRINAKESEVTALRGQLELHEKSMSEVRTETARSSVSKLLNDTTEKLERALVEIKRLRSQSFETTGAPKVFNGIQQVLRSLDDDPMNPEAWKEKELNHDLLTRQLNDQNTRLKLSRALPDCIDQVIVDLVNQRYTVKFLTGGAVVERDLSVVLAARRKEINSRRALKVQAGLTAHGWRHPSGHGLTDQAKARLKQAQQKASAKRRQEAYVRRPITEETRAKLVQSRKAMWAKRRAAGNTSPSAEARAKMSEAQKRVWEKKRADGTDKYTEERRANHCKAQKLAWEKRRAKGPVKMPDGFGARIGKANKAHWARLREMAKAGTLPPAEQARRAKVSEDMKRIWAKRKESEKSGIPDPVLEKARQNGKHKRQEKESPGETDQG